MWTMLITIYGFGSIATTSISGFSTQELCEKAIQKIYSNNKVSTIVASCVQNKN